MRNARQRRSSSRRSAVLLAGVVLLAACAPEGGGDAAPCGCSISGSCLDAGALNPSNPCQLCDPESATTSWSTKPDGARCDADANGCTVGDACRSGACVPGSAAPCDDGFSCTADSCANTGAATHLCENTLVAGKCLVASRCRAAGELHPTNACQVCDPGRATTSWSNAPDGTSCSDPDGCTIGDACQAGACAPGAAVSCDDGLSCTADSCTSTGPTGHRCASTLVPGQCLIASQCHAAGVANPSNPCQLCDPEGATTSWSNVAEGTACEADANGCTVADACHAGACQPGPAADCADGLACTADSCTSTGPASFVCAHPPAPEFTDCGTYSNGGETFVWQCDPAGVCVFRGTQSSCPMLYAWTGGEPAFESDMYPSGALGLVIGDGSYRKPDPHDAYVLRHALAEKDGALDLRLVEELDEIDYLDRARLFAIDVPADRQLVAIANNAPRPYAPVADRVLTIALERRPLVSAVHLQTGRDVAAQLSASDGDDVVLSEDMNASYWNTIEVDLGEFAAAETLKLVVDGRSRFPSTPEGKLHSRITNPSGVPTRLEVVDATGQWVEVARSRVTLVKPKEFPRPMAIDIGGIFPTSDHRMRLSWFNKTYLDAIWLDTTPAAPLAISEAPLLRADLVRHGFSEYTRGTEIPEYFYSTPRADGFALGAGSYTRHGDVTPLLDLVDDMFAIYGAGDEISMRFQPVAPPAAGLRRDYVLETAGYYKQDKPGLVSFTVEPLPFEAMTNFPYDPAVEHYPDDAAHVQYREAYDTRRAP